jgi:apolipoprotein N-acyltransferase
LLRGLAESVTLATGWRARGMAAAAGAVAALGMAPLDLWPAGFLAFPVAVWLVDGIDAAHWRFSPRGLLQAAAAGWWFGFGYFLAGLWWLGAAFLVETDEFAWALPLGVLGMPAGLALFHALGFALARLLWSPGALRVAAFASALAAAEWLRGTVLTGFPWNSHGQALAAFPPAAQAAAVIGLPGLTLVYLLLAAAPATLATGRTPARRVLPSLVAAVALAALSVLGVWRLAGQPTEFHAGVRLRIMQPNVSQREKHRMGGQELLARYLALSDRPTGPATRGLADVTHLFWPESPFPFFLAREPRALARIGDALKGGSVTLLTGAARVEDTAGPGGRQRYFNALQVVRPDGSVGASYDKTHLVPFGEYLPFREALDRLGLRQFVEVPGGFDAGSHRPLMEVAGLPPLLPLICYEAIFPDEASGRSGRPELLVNVTNDAWFGQTPGPWQHLAQARLRTIEQGVPMVRAANTGVSAVIDPSGRVVAQLALGQEGVVDSRLPRAISPTIYARFGDKIPGALLLICILSSIAGAVSARRLAR